MAAEVKETKVVGVTAVQWGPDVNGMMHAAEVLGNAGLMFSIKSTTPEEEARGIDILPELEILDQRFRKHVVTPGLWIVLHPGYRNFRVVDKATLDGEYA